MTNLARVTQVAAMTVDDLQSPIRYGHSSLSAALYRWCSLRWLMALWGATIKRYDNQRPLFTGMLSTYRAIISVPAMYDVVVPAVYPAVAEADWQTHNVHAVDMARRANASIAIPVYASQIQKEQVSIGRLMPWIELAALHGAGGVGFNSWKPFDENDELRASLSQLLDELNATGAFLATPAPTAAFLYIPFGEGFTVQEAPLYGFATPHGQPIATPPRLSIGEPNKPFASFQLGTRYGQFDYISLETLSQTAVNRYSAIFAPVPLYMSSSITGPNGQPMPALGIPTAPALLQRLGVRADPTWINPAAWLAQYVSAGGVLVTDIGASLAVGGDTFRLLPPDFAQLIGAAGIRLLIVDPNIALSMSVLFNHPLFPSLPAGSRIGATTTPFRTVAGVLRFMSARAWALMMRAPRRRRRISREAVAMCINAIGRGFVVHAPTLLWANWLPQSPDFIAFHNDLLKRRAAVNLISARGLFSPNVHVALFTDGVASLNVSTQTQLAIAEVATGAHARSTLMNAHVEFPAGSNSSAVLVRQVIQPLEFAFVGLLPIRVQCNSRFVAVVNDY
ncbi:MAG TPA: hypothetical protein EYP10_11205, partial [Armatimonadetes bacterium]|nr:hypothetical protein [Armatimonadota bacterium]